MNILDISYGVFCFIILTTLFIFFIFYFCCFDLNLNDWKLVKYIQETEELY